MYRILTTTLSLIGLVCTLMAQSGYRMSRFDVSRGLSQNTVNAMIEDQHGFIWFGTQDGLSRFDGERFTTWPFEEQDGSLSDDFITALELAPSGRLYVGTRNGLNGIDRTRTQVRLIDKLGFSGNTFHNTVHQIVCIDDRVYYRSGSVLCSFIDAQQITIDTVRHEVMSIAHVNGRLTVVDRAGRLFIKHPTKGFDEITPVSNMNLKQVFTSDSGSSIYAASDETLLRINLDHREVESVWELPSSITNVYQRNKLIYLATELGLYFIENDGAPFPIQAVSSECQGLERDHIRCFVRDIDGGIWVGSTKFGAFRHDARTRHILHLPGALFADPVVWSAAYRPDGLLVGSSSGLDYFSCEPDWLTPSFNPEARLKHRQRITGLQVSCVLVTDELVWVATRTQGVQAYAWSENDLTPIPEATVELDAGAYHLAINDANELLITTSKGTVIRKPDGTLEHIRLSNLSDDPISDYAHHMLVSKNRLAYSTMTGFHQFDRQTGTLYVGGPLNSKSNLEVPFIASATNKSGGGYWLSTLGSGLLAVDEDALQVIHSITTSNGLTNDVVYGSVETNQELLASTNAGLTRINLQGEVLGSYSTMTGLPFDEHSQNAFGKHEEFAWFGGVDGFYIVLPEAFQQKEPVPQPVITELRVNFEICSFANLLVNEPTLGAVALTEAPQTDYEIHLYPGDNALSLGLALPGVFSRDYLMRYRMQGVVADWVALRANDERINFTTLPAGKHLLEISALHKNGIQENHLHIGVWVHPPFWEQTWFILALAITLVGVTFVVVREAGKRRLRSEILKRLAVERVKQERERISMDLHDNIGSHITHVITTLDNLSYKATALQPEQTAQRLDALSDFARTTMQQLRDTIWTLAQEEITVHDFYQRLNDYFSRVFQDMDAPVYTIECSDEADAKILPELAVQAFRVVQECLSNALKHAHAQTISVLIRSEHQRLKIKFSDNGKGFQYNLSSPREGHYGLLNMQRRVEQLNGNLAVRTAPGEGTVIDFELPLPS